MKGTKHVDPDSSLHRLSGQEIAGLPLPHEEVRRAGRAAGAQPQGRLPLPDQEGPRHGQRHGQTGGVPLQDEEDALRGGGEEAGQLPLQDQGSKKCKFEITYMGTHLNGKILQ